MSSFTRRDIGAGMKIIGSTDANSPLSNERVQRLGLTKRQRDLNWLWAWYRCASYDARGTDWDGTPTSTHLEHEAISSASYVPQGFVDAGAAMMPLKFRRPTAPYNLIRVIVDRFTGLLFSERRHPVVRVQGDPDTEDYVRALAEQSRLWAKMILARQLGGAMGSVAAGFKFVEGRAVVEIHDPRWCQIDFEDRETLKVNRFEKRYQYSEEQRDPETGLFVDVSYWYRRIIDKQRDVVFEPALVDEGDEPKWVEAETVEHKLGFCPIVWTQNLPVLDDVDGDPDCHGVFDMVESMDALIAQGFKGTIGNSDPTLHIASNQEMGGDIGKGTGNAIKTESGGSVKYVELQGTGPKSAREMAAELRSYVLEVTQCVLDHPDMQKQQRTATEVERTYSSMLAKADIMREQYGERLVKPLLEMMIQAAKKVSRPEIVSVGEDGDPEQKRMISRGKLKLPPKVEADGSEVARALGNGGVLNLSWPRYFEPTPQEIGLSVDAAGKAKATGLIDGEHASNAVAEFYNVEDVPGMIKQIKTEQKQFQAEAEQQMMDRMNEPDASQGDQ